MHIKCNVKAGKISYAIATRVIVALVIISGLFPAWAHAGRGKTAFPHKATFAKRQWVGTWGTARQLVDANNMPPAPGLSNNTLRQVVCASIGGKKLRLKLSNQFGKSPITIKAVQIAVSKGNGVIDVVSNVALTFNGKPEVTLEPGMELWSDPAAFKLKPRMEVAITITFGETPETLTGHNGSRTTSYLLAGQQLSANAEFTNAVKTDHWYVITGIDVEASKSAGAVAVFGDSITDGRGSGTNKQNRWPDLLAVNLQQDRQTRNVGVLNMGIGGNAVLRGGLGPTGINRFEHDVLRQSGIRWLIIFEGVNDLGVTRDSLAATNVAKELITAFDQMITMAHARGIKVYGATIMPFKGNGYYRPYRDKARNMVNEWIRTSKHFDEVIDFDQVMRDPNDPAALLNQAQSGANDYLHPNEFGYSMMANAVKIAFFK